MIYRLAWVLVALVLLPLAGPRAQPRSHIAVFDGGTPSIVSPAGADAIKASEAICLELWVAADKNALDGPMTVATLTAADATWSLVIADQRQAIVLSAGAGAASVSVPVDLTGGRMVHLGFTFAPTGTVIYVDGYELPQTGPAFVPQDDKETVSLALGGAGFKGSIGAARLWSVGMDDPLMLASRNDPDTFVPQGGLPVADFTIGQVEGGQLARPAVPAIGLWHQNGGGSNIPVLRNVAGVPDSGHGQFVDDEMYISLFPSELPWAQFAFTTSRVNRLQEFYLVQGPSLGVYFVNDARQNRIGRLTFRPSGRVFTVNGIPPDSVLKAGDVYKTLEVPLDGEQTQAYGEAWQVNDKPKNFENSVMGCYSSQHMNMFDLQEHGCNRRLFREPPAFSHRFDTGRNNLTIPWGWKYLNFSESRAHGFSSMATTSGGIGSNVSNAVGYDGTFAGVTYQHNETVEAEREDIRENKAMRAYHEFVARRQSLVVDAKKMMLDQCFLRDIVRLTYGLTGKVPALPAYFDPDDTAGGDCDALLDAPLSLDDFVGRYADLYAYAITYGARAIQRVDLSASSVATLAEHNTNVSDGIDYHVKGSVDVPGSPVKAEFKFGGGYNRENGKSAWDNTTKDAELNFDDLICIGGNSCVNAQVEVGDNPVPIYLDLRSIADLLGPPYFADPAITVTARRALRARLAQNAPPPVADMPLMRVFDVTLTAEDCSVGGELTNTAPLDTMSQTGLADFAANGRLGAAGSTQVPTFPPYMKDYSSYYTHATGACFAVLSSARVEFAGANLGSAGNFPPLKILTIPGQDRSPPLSDFANKQASARIMVSMFDAALGGGQQTHPYLYPRLRSPSDPNLGQDDCAAPCALSEDPKQPGFVVYPVFDGIDLAAVPVGGGTFDVVVARGASNLGDPSVPAWSYGVGLKLVLKEVTNIANAIGY